MCSSISIVIFAVVILCVCLCVFVCVYVDTSLVYYSVLFSTKICLH